MVKLPFAPGREQSGQRPAIVIQDAGYGQASPVVLVVPLTSQLGALRFPGTFRIEPGPGNGLRAPSVTMVFQVRALDRSRFARRIGVITAGQLDRLFSTLDELTGRQR